jgi:drug/metabolite transporter (DMT)-like permease
MIIPSFGVAILSSLYTIIYKIISNKLSVESVLILSTYINLILTIIYTYYHKEKLYTDINNIDIATILLLLFMTIGCGGTIKVFTNKLMHYNKPFKIALITSISPLLTMYLSHFIFNEQINNNLIIGSLITLFGIVYMINH